MKDITRLFLIATVLMIVGRRFGLLPCAEERGRTAGGRSQRGWPPLLQFLDDMDPDSLILAMKRNFEFLDRLPLEPYFITGPMILFSSRCERVK